MANFINHSQNCKFCRSLVENSFTNWAFVNFVDLLHKNCEFHQFIMGKKSSISSTDHWKKLPILSISCEKYFPIILVQNLVFPQLLMEKLQFLFFEHRKKSRINSIGFRKKLISSIGNWKITNFVDRIGKKNEKFLHRSSYKISNFFNGSWKKSQILFLNRKIIASIVEKNN